MKYLLGTLYILIGLILWLIIMIPSFIIRCSWVFNIKAYNFEFNFYDYAISNTTPCVYSIYGEKNYDYKSYFHYLFNIKKSIKW